MRMEHHPSRNEGDDTDVRFRIPIDDETNDRMDDDGSSGLGDEDDPHEPTQPSHRAQAAMNERKQLAQRETRLVGRLRLYLLVFLAITAALCGWATYKYTRAVEVDEFESRFASIADSVSDSFHNAVERKLGALDALSVSVTSYAKQSGETFPTVTLPDFETRGANTRILADGVYVFWLPLVKDDQRAAWEAYAYQKHAHLYQSFGTEVMLRTMQDQSFGLLEQQGSGGEGGAGGNPGSSRMLSEQEMEMTFMAQDFDTLMTSSRRLQDGAFQTYIPTIWNFQGPQPPGSGPFFPMWQVSPVVPLVGLLNFNFVAFEGDGILFEVLRSEQAIIGGVALDIKDREGDAPDTTEGIISAMLQLGQYRYDDAASFQSDPLTPVAYPVFDGFGSDKNFTGALYSAVYWRLLFQDILPADVQGVICVLQNTGGFAEGGANDPPFTFRLDGPDVTFMGVGDLHDPEYDSLRVSHDVSRYIQQRASPRTRAYTTSPFNSEYNTYILDIYPSDDMKDDFVTNQPYIFMAAITGVFLFVLITFMLYDWLVERRQRMVMDRAVKSTAVVSSLFPDAIREQLFKEVSEDIDVGKKKKGKEWEISEELERSLELMMEDKTRQRSKRRGRGKALADKYPETTVFFMDLAGFTAWSSDREPEDVFLLLETLYEAYDRIALRRDVFKVETIGDCYMAVTGLPKPQKDHAYRMAKFAMACQAKTSLVLQELKESLGEDTVTLGCRIGLHSGPVTAGVLRGDKGRFQLFGDTVNTASRMESTGEKGKIQCSATTANLLIESGRESWLEKRADPIKAKGKGEMETWWILPKESIGTSVGTSSAGSTIMSDDPPRGGIHRRQYPDEMSEF
mmetsp:Transcript_12076/g.23087  ORF Transcript_12076/g.23087 Transcript_12076/m.23087 type:complete len:851 (-) Transcript_12076:163-2715(-)